MPWYQSQEEKKKTIKKPIDKYPSWTLMQKKILNKILANKIQQLLKGLHIMTKWDSFLECTDIRLAKRFLWFLSKSKRHILHFYQGLYWTTYSPKWWWNQFFPLSSAIFRQLHYSVFPKLFIFLSKELFQVIFYSLPGNRSFFH